MAEVLDLNKLSFVLDITGKDNTSIKECEEKFSIYKSLPKFGPLLLLLACNKDNQYPETISLNAAIQLKNYINSYWKYTNDPNINEQLCFDNEQIIIISEEDKNFIKNNILEGVVYIVEKENVKILKQFNQCVKKILKLDYKEKWNTNFVECIIKCFESNNQKQIYAGIMLLYQLSKLFQFEDAQNQKIYNEVLIKVNNKLLFFINECKGLKNNVEAMVIYKLIKIFFKSFQTDIPELFQKEEVFNSWSEYIVLILKTPLEQQYIEDKKNIFWKLKHICFQTLTRIIQKYTNLSVKKKNEFQINLDKKYTEIYYELFKVIYTNYNNNQSYVDDYGKSYIYTLFAYLLGKKDFKEKIIKLFVENDGLLEEIIKDCFMTKEDLETWVNDPKNYIAQKAEEISMYTSKRFRTLKLITSLLDCKEKKTKKYLCYNKIFDFLCNSMIKDAPNLEQEINTISKLIKDPKDESYLTNPNNIPHILYKESIIFIIKSNSEIIIKNSDVETLIGKYILPELNSPCGLLREQSCHFISNFGPLEYKNNQLLEEIIKNLCKLMEGDPQLSVRLYASLAIGSLFNKTVTKTLLKGNIQKIFEIYLKLMDETDIEEIMDNLQEIVKYFTEESQQYIVQLSDYLIKYFNKIISKENDEENGMDSYTLISNIVTTFCNFIQYFINNQNIYPNIEKYIDILLEYCFNNAYDKLEEGLDLIEAILKYGNSIPNHVWKFYIPLVESVIGSEEELNDFKKEFPNQVFNGNGYESILDIAKLVSIFIAKDPNTFLTMQVKTGVKYFDYAIKLIESIIAISESKSSYSEIKYSLRIIMTLLDCYKGKIDMFLDQIVKYILIKYKINKIDKKLENYLQNLLSACFIYDPLKTLQIFQKENCTKDIFIFWFKGLDNLKQMQDMKYNLLGICSLISIEQDKQDKLIIENMNQILEKIYLITEKISEMFKEKEKNNENKNEEINDDNVLEEGLEGGENNMDEMLKKIIDGEPGYGEDDDLSYEEEDDDDKPLTNFEKQSPILFVKNTLNAVSQKSPDIYKIIVDTLGEKINDLKEIFSNEEKRIANNNK